MKNIFLSTTFFPLCCKIDIYYVYCVQSLTVKVVKVSRNLETFAACLSLCLTHSPPECPLYCECCGPRGPGPSILPLQQLQLLFLEVLRQLVPLHGSGRRLRECLDRAGVTTTSRSSPPSVASLGCRPRLHPQWRERDREVVPRRFAQDGMIQKGASNQAGERKTKFLVEFVVNLLFSLLLPFQLQSKVFSFFLSFSSKFCFVPSSVLPLSFC